MTDLKPTMNEQIALELGWTRLDEATIEPYRLTYGVARLWKNPEGELQENIPDFEHDWAHAGPLLAEMADIEVVHLLKIDGEERWMCGLSIRPEDLIVRRSNTEGSEPTQAISRAWLEWKKEAQ